jgi:hypothetical protein
MPSRSFLSGKLLGSLSSRAEDLSIVLSDPDHALPTEQLVSETADLSNVGATGLGGLGSRETAQAKLEKDHERKYEASRPATEPDGAFPTSSLLDRFRSRAIV